MRTDSDYYCARAPAAVCVLTEASEDEKRLTIRALDPLRGPGNVLREIERDPAGSGYASALSPDGTSVAVSQGGEPQIHIRLLSLSGGSDRNITVKDWSNTTGLDWSADGKGLYVGSGSPPNATLLYVGLDANTRVVWQVKRPGGIWGVASPDGRYVAIGAQFTGANLWMLEGF